MTVSTDRCRQERGGARVSQGPVRDDHEPTVGSADRAAQAAFGLKWNASQPFTVVIGPDGKVLYQKEGAIDIREVRREILSSVPDNPSWPGVHDYFQAAVARMAARRK